MTSRTRGLIVWAVPFALLASFVTGRYTRSPRVVTRDVVRTQTVEVEKVRTVTVHDVVQAKAVEAKTRTIVVTRTRWLPGGTVEKETTTSAATDTDTHETRQARTAVEASKDVRIAATTVELHTIERLQPRWSFALQPGAQLFGAKAITLAGPLVLGLSVEHRFIGPVSLGIWGNTSGSAGISIRGDL